MNNNILNLSLKMMLLIIFIFTSIGDTMPRGYSDLSYAALRPLAYKRSKPGPSLSPDEERLQEAESLYRENDLTKLSQASDILLDYIYSGDENLQAEAKRILKSRDNFFVIQEKPEEKKMHQYGKTDYPAGTVPSLEVFRNNLWAGLIRPVVIVNIKSIYSRIELAYTAEMRRISRYYNGNVTFILRVEEPKEFPADLPGATKILHDSMEIMGEDFKNTLTIQIPDGGLKTRLGPISLRYHMQGLVPYYREVSELQEAFTRSGRMIMQLPNKGAGDHIICASDNIAEPRTFHLDSSDSRNLQMPSVENPRTISEQAREQFALMLFIGERAEGFVADIPPEKVKHILETEKRARINNPCQIVIWKKERLSEHINLAYSMNMENGKPLAYAPINLHREFVRSLFHTTEQWKREYKKWKKSNRPAITAAVKLNDWMSLRELALKALGRNAKRINFVLGKARDEGRLERLMARFKKRFRALNRVKREPGITLLNAADAGLDNVVFRGKGTVIFGGPDVLLRNTIVELKEGEVLYIPDGWVIKDSYIGQNTFEEGGGLLIGATYYKDDVLLPLRLGDKKLRANSRTSVISRLDKEPQLIFAKFDKPTTVYAGRRKYTFDEIRKQVDADESRRALYLLQETLNQEFDGMPRIFPLNITACKRLIGRPIEKRIHDLAIKIAARQKKQRGGQHDVYIEGVQGAEKDRFAERLAKSLRRRGKHVVLLKEIWYHKPDQEIETLCKDKPEEWRRHSKNWYRWDKLEKDLRMIRKKKRGRIALKKLYSPSTGKCNLKKTLTITPGTIFIYAGFYTQDIVNMAKFHGQDQDVEDFVKDLLTLPSRPSTRIYLGLNQKDSLKVKLKRDKKWYGKEEIRLLDRKVYRRSFSNYISTYDPAAYSDHVFRIDLKDRYTITEVEPYTRLWREKRPREDNPPAVKNVLIFGAGAIGRGLFAFDFRRSGYKIHFVDADQKLVKRLNKKRQYEVRHLRTLSRPRVKLGVSRKESHTHLVDEVTATPQNEMKKIEEQVFEADAICLAVPDANLPVVSALLGRCLQNRILRGNTDPVNVYLSTNRPNAGEYVERLILRGVSEENYSQFRKYVGIVETGVEGITRAGTERQRQVGSTKIYGDSLSGLVVDEKRLKGHRPDVVGMSLAGEEGTDITREKKRRLFLFESAYSLVAYLGHLRGYTYITEAWHDPWIKSETKKLLRIASSSLIKKCGFTPNEQDIYSKDLRNRLENEVFKDPVIRQARDPIRKLRPGERFVGLARLIKDTDIEQEGIIALAIAACLRYHNPKDEQSVYLHSRLEAGEIEKVLKNICNIDPDSRLGRLIMERYDQFEEFKVAYAGLTLVNPRRTEGTTDIIMGFDGVVANTNPILRESFAYVYWKIMNGIADDDKRRPTQKQLSKGEMYFNNILGSYFIGEIIEDVIEQAKDSGIAPEKLKSTEAYLAEYREIRDTRIRKILDEEPEALIAPGIRRLLADLTGLKKKIYLSTKAYPPRVEEIIEPLGLGEYFSPGKNIIYSKDMNEKITKIDWLMRNKNLRPPNVIFIDESPWVIEEVRKKFPEMCIVAIREGLGKNDRKLFDSANFILDNFIPSKNKLSIFFSTKGLTVPKGFRFPEQAAGPVDVTKLGGEERSIRRTDSAA